VAAFYADENFPREVVEALRDLGHDVLTALEAGQANQALPDEAVIEFAGERDRAILTLNRWQFIGRHKRDPEHAGMVVCTPDPDTRGQAARIDEAVRDFETLRGALLRINRPSRR
jgi:hypothetical protein